MTDEVVSTESKVTEPLTDVSKESPAPAEAKNTDHMIPKTRLDEEIQKRKEIEKQAREATKRIQEFEALEQKRKEAEMSESEKAQARIKELEDAKLLLETKQRDIERRELQRKVAKSINLPEGLAERLRGGTEEELLEDAKLVLEFLPKQETKPDATTKPKLEPTNPGNGTKGETRDQVKARLNMGKTSNPWGAADAQQRGGGALFVEKGD